jgi:hypothetical protein
MVFDRDGNFLRSFGEGLFHRGWQQTNGQRPKDSLSEAFIKEACA